MVQIMTVDRTTAHLKRGIRVSRAQFERLWNSEQTLAEIGETLGGITHAAVIHRAKQFGLPARAFDGRKTMTSFDENLFRFMWQSGVSYADLASHFGMGLGAVKMRRKRLGLPVRTSRKHVTVADAMQPLLSSRMAADAQKTNHLLRLQARLLQAPSSMEASL